ncbi:MAG: hypothetical protein EPO65_06425 [Dehalococcoidia bacterium]|nr:MAG: hypothetical protein EPO65_06425 [Dehalococcoidia bacterium]
MKPINDVATLFENQRAVRAFSDRPVDDTTVTEVIRAATHAPSSQNAQPWRFIVVRDPAQKAVMSEVYEECFLQVYGAGAPARADGRQPWTQVPVLIVCCIGVQGRPNIATGASIYPAVQNLMLRARSLGLGTVMTTLFRLQRDRFHEILGIPEGWEAAAIIPLGWPDRNYGPNHRPPVDEVVMRDRWTEPQPNL